MKIEIPNKIIGLDLSLTSTGVAVYSVVDNSDFTRVIKTNNKNSYMDRYHKILAEIEREILDLNSIVFIEGYSLGSFSKSTAMSNLIELGGIIRASLWKRNVKYVVVPPTTLKKFLTGKGNSKKEDIKLNVYKKYGKEFKTSDEADAYGLMALGYAFLCNKTITGKELTSVERDCCSKLKGDENATEIN